MTVADLPLDASDSLERLLRPVGMSEFLRAYWQVQPLRLHRHYPDFYGDLFSLQDFDVLLNSSGVRAPEVRLLREEKDLEFSAKLGSPTALGLAYDTFRSGGSIVLNQVHERHARLGLLCNHIAAYLWGPVGVNAYLTAPSGQALHPHYDTHDVIVLQVHGSKRWTLYDAPTRLPPPGRRFRREDMQETAVSEEFVLECGDLLYIPRGTIHRAIASAEASLHLTVGIRPLTWHALIATRLNDYMVEQAAFSAAITPRSQDADELMATAQQLHSLVVGLATPANFALWAREMARLAVHPRMDGRLRDLVGIEYLTGSEVLYRRELPVRLEESGGRATLTFLDRRVSFPDYVTRTLEFILAARRFRLEDLPEEIDFEGRLNLVRTLVQEGLLGVEREP